MVDADAHTDAHTGANDAVSELTLDQAEALIDALPDALKRQIDEAYTWAPLPGPQLQAWTSEADELFFGGAAGGGKTDFVCGLALEQHQHSVVYRREGTQLEGITDRLSDILGGREQFSGATGNRVWRLGERTIEYGSMPNLGDERKQQGRPRDLLIFDEVPQFTQFQYSYLQTWNRSTNTAQRCRSVATGNPPTEPEGLWVIQYWAPWLDDQHPLYGQVMPGELVWYLTLDGTSTIVDNEEPVWVPERNRYIKPRSRTFIPSLVEDNPFLMRTGYGDDLESLPEPLRSQMRDGDFKAGQQDHEWQVIPSAWVDAAQRRWVARQHETRGAMSSMGVDPARGGRDDMVLAPRYGTFFDKLIETPGAAIKDGPAGAALCIQHQRNGCLLNVDIIGVGTSVVDHLEGLRLKVNAINGAAASFLTSKTGALKFRNLRAALYWRFRELLDPTNPDPIAIPPGNPIKMDLTAARYKLVQMGQDFRGAIQVEDKEAIISRLKRSPDRGDALVYAAHEYESPAHVSQAVMEARHDPHFDGPYVREETLEDQRNQDNQWCEMGGKIHYPDT